MSAPKTRREFEIWKVCDQMVAEGIPGIRVTGEAIRERLFEAGLSKGSPNEIYKYRKHWREARGVEEEDFHLPMINQIKIVNPLNKVKQGILSDPLVRAVEAIRAEIQKETSAELEKFKKLTEEELLAIKTEKEEAEQVTKRLMDTNQNLLEENEKLKLDCQNFQTLLLEEKQFRMAKEERLKVLEEAWLKFEENTNTVVKELKRTQLETRDQYHKQLEFALQKNQELIANQNLLDEINTSLKQEIINYLRCQQSA